MFHFIQMNTLLALSVLFICNNKTSATVTFMIGVDFLNYTNYQGAMRNGSCCDAPTLAPPHCPEDRCDTVIEKYAGTTPDGQEFTRSQQFPVIPNDNNIVFHGSFGVNGTNSLNIYKSPFIHKPIYYTIKAYHSHIVQGTNANLIATWRVNITWRDLIYDPAVNFRHFILKDKNAELGIRVVAQCLKHYFDTECKTYCKPRNVTRWMCTENGTETCKPGWSPPNCNKKVPCEPNMCRPGGTCQNTTKGEFNCTCLPNYTGLTCSKLIATTGHTTSTTASSTILKSTSKLMATTAHTTSTTASSTILKSTSKLMATTAHTASTTASSTMSESTSKLISTTAHTASTTASSTMLKPTSKLISTIVHTTSTTTTQPTTGPEQSIGGHTSDGEDLIPVAVGVPVAFILLLLLVLLLLWYFKNKNKRTSAVSALELQPYTETGTGPLDHQKSF